MREREFQEGEKFTSATERSCERKTQKKTLDLASKTSR